MGLREMIGLGGSDSSDTTDESDSSTTPNRDKYRVIAQDPDTNQAVSHPEELDSGEWIFENEPMTKEQFRYQYGDMLDGGTKYLCVGMTSRGHPDFDRIQWQIETESNQQGRDELQELRREIRSLQDSPQPAGDQDIEDMVLHSLMSGQLDPQTAEQIVDLKAKLEAAKNGNQTDFFENADPSDPQEVATAGLMNLTRQYDSLGDMISDLGEGALSGVAGGVGPTAGQQQPPAQQQPAQQQPTQQSQETDSPDESTDTDTSNVENLVADIDDTDGSDADQGDTSTDDTGEEAAVSVDDADDQEPTAAADDQEPAQTTDNSPMAAEPEHDTDEW